MGIFKHYAPKYWDNGIVTIPCEGKRPLPKKWQEWPNDTDEQRLRLNELIRKNPDANIGMPTGKINKVICLDLDIGEEKFLNEILNLLAPCAPRKIGKKGEALFFNYSGQKSKKSERFVNSAGDTVGIELLSDGNQTILPPSIHPDTKKPYSWHSNFMALESSKLDDVDLQKFSDDDFDTLVKAFYKLCKKYGYGPINGSGNGSSNGNGHHKNDYGKKPSGRNNKLKDVVVAMLGRGEDFEAIVAEVYATDIKLYSEYALFRDLDEKLDGKTPFDRCRSFCKSIAKSVKKEPPKPKEISTEGDKRRLLTSYGDFKEFFDSLYPNAIKEKLSGYFLYLQDNQKWQFVLSELKLMKSHAHEKGLSRNFVDDHIHRYISELKPRLLIEPKKWDGEDRLLKIFTKFKFKDDKVDPNHALDLFKEWCANIFRRSENPMNQNFILIFRGPQGIGKDYFISNVIGKAFGYYFVNLEPQENNRENYMSVIGKLVANISEFDATQKMGVSSIKNLISANSIHLRMPYGVNYQNCDLHCSFFSSSNFDYILRDSSGNRRYVIFDIEDIDKTYDELINPEQILAQIYHLFQTDFRAPLSAHEQMRELIHQETPDDEDDLIFASILHEIRSVENSIGGRKILYSDIENSIKKVATHYNVKVKRVQSVIKRRGLQAKNDKFLFYTTEKYKNEGLN